MGLLLGYNYIASKNAKGTIEYKLYTCDTCSHHDAFFEKQLGYFYPCNECSGLMEWDGKIVLKPIIETESTFEEK